MQRIMWGLMLIALACGDTTGDAPIETQEQTLPPAVSVDHLLDPGPDDAPLEPIQLPNGEAPMERAFMPEGDPYADADGSSDGDVDKANDTYVGLTGWAMHGHLRFQNGVVDPAPATPVVPDHCARFGLSCDNRWHIQAADIDITSRADWFDGDSFRGSPGRCGTTLLRDDGTDNEYFPCIYPFVHQDSTAGRNVPYFVDYGTCPNDAGRRRNIEVATAAISSWMTLNTNVRMPLVTDFASAEVIFQCEGGLSSSTAAQARPSGPLQLRYAIAGNIEDVGGWVDTCETSGLPGSNPAASYTQRPDMYYTSQKHIVAINWSAMFSFIESCNPQPLQRSTGIYNILLHELGHVFTFAHDAYVNVGRGIMRTGMTCEEIVAQAYGFSDLHRETINELDGNPNNAALDIHDNDLSCFKPVGQ